MGRHAGKERCTAVQIRPGALVEQEIMEPHASERRLIFFQTCEQSAIAAPTLRQEGIVDDAGRLNQLGQSFFGAWGQHRRVDAQFHRSEARDHAFQLRQIGDGWLGGLRHYGSRKNCQQQNSLHAIATTSLYPARDETSLADAGCVWTVLRTVLRGGERAGNPSRGISTTSV